MSSLVFHFHVLPSYLYCLHHILEAGKPISSPCHTKEGLLKQNFQDCRSALSEAKAAASVDWAEPNAAESVGHLSRWDDLHSLFMVETVGDAQRGWGLFGENWRMPAAVGCLFF